MAFQYVSGWSMRPPALAESARSMTPGSTRSLSAYPITIVAPSHSPGSAQRATARGRRSAAAAISVPA
jgi:hypothetical protein